MDRLTLLRDMAAKRPDDPFPSYGVGMELRKQGQSEAAATEFAGLLERHPGYVATYLMYGNLLRELGRNAAAAEVYDAGITAAHRAGDAHAESELEAARAELS